jgi:hypothetical protein
MTALLTRYGYLFVRCSRFLRATAPLRALTLTILLTLSVLGVKHSIAQSQNVQEQQAPSETSSSPITSEAAFSTGGQDPLNSPHPIPWSWIVAGQYASTPLNEPQMRYYRSQALVSPDQRYAAYSRIQMQIGQDDVTHTVDSMLFLEDLQTGELQFVTASSPSIRHPGFDRSRHQQPGMITVLLPIAWSEVSDRLLIRGFDSRFGTDLASDYAIVWNRQTQEMRAIAPSPFHYSNAVLLGWSQNNPSHVLFRAGQMGDEQWPMVAVDPNNSSFLAAGDQPIAYGQAAENFWNGPQARIETRP